MFDLRLNLESLPTVFSLAGMITDIKSAMLASLFCDLIIFQLLISCLFFCKLGLFCFFGSCSKESHHFKSTHMDGIIQATQDFIGAARVNAIKDTAASR